MVKRKIVTLNPDAEVSNPKQAAIIQLEILRAVCDQAIKALKLENRHVYDDRLNAIRRSASRLHRLSYKLEANSSDDRRLVDTFKRAHLTSDYSVQTFDDNGSRAIGIEGMYDIDTLCKYMSW